MKYNAFFKAAAAISMAMTLFAACGKKDDPGKDVPEKEIVTAFDDLSYFQNTFVKTVVTTEDTDAHKAGETIYTAYLVGKPIYENDPTNLYVGVEDLDEALEYWDACLAPDVNRTFSATHNYTYTLTDAEGKSQGTVSFTPGAGGSVAQITTNLAGLEHFEKVTFILNSAWPFNTVYGQTRVGDARVMTVNVENDFYPFSETVTFICVQEASAGVPPFYVGFSKRLIEPFGEQILMSDYCPAETKAKRIYDYLHKDWDFFAAVFEEAGVDLNLNDACWIDEKDSYTFWTYQYGVNLTKNEFELEKWEYYYSNPRKRALLKIDWIDDASLFYVPGSCSGAVDADEEARNLFDGQNGTKWCTHTNYHTEPSIAFSGKKCWFVEFETVEPVNPAGYDIVTANDTKKYTGRNPKEWALLARKSGINNEWTILDKRSGEDLPHDNYKTKNFKLNTTPGGKDWKYFRLEVTENSDNGACMQFSEFRLTY